MSIWKLWDPKEIEILRQLSEAGATYYDAAKILKSRTTDSIRIKCRHLGISLNGTPPEIDFDAFKALLRKQKVIRER
jgi:hypothetical protein